jgi:hypothetical protein
MQDISVRFEGAEVSSFKTLLHHRPSFLSFPSSLSGKIAQFFVSKWASSNGKVHLNSPSFSWCIAVAVTLECCNLQQIVDVTDLPILRPSSFTNPQTYLLNLFRLLSAYVLIFYLVEEALTQP